MKQRQHKISKKLKMHIWQATKVGVDFVSNKYNSVTNVTDRFSFPLWKIFCLENKRSTSPVHASCPHETQHCRPYCGHRRLHCVLYVAHVL